MDAEVQFRLGARMRQLENMGHPLASGMNGAAGWMLDHMDVGQAVAIVSTLVPGRWLDSHEAATETLRGLGFTLRPGADTTLDGGSVLHDLEHPPGIDQASLTTLDGDPVGITFLIASVLEPHNSATDTTYRALLAALSEILGPAEQVWADQPTPVHWHAGEIDVGAQLFDRRDSSVMVWVEHRSHSHEAESRAG